MVSALHIYTHFIINAALKARDDPRDPRVYQAETHTVNYLHCIEFASDNTEQ